MRPRDRDTSPSRSTNTRSSSQSRVTASHNKQQLDDLVRSILSYTLSKFDGDAEDKTRDASQTQSQQDGPQNNELARLVLGQVAHFVVSRYLTSRKNKREQSQRQHKTKKAMPFLFGSGGRPLGSGERERMQRRREASRSVPYSSSYDTYSVSYSVPYNGNEEIHLTDPLPPEPEPVVPPAPYCPPRDAAPEPKLRRRRRHHNLSGRDKDTGGSDAAAPEPSFVPPLSRSYTWDASRSPYAYHPNYPVHDGYPPLSGSRRRRTGPSSAADLPTRPVSPYIPAETPREQQRRRVSERDSDRERRNREYEAERRQRKGERPREAESRRGERDKDRRGDRDRERARDKRERERDKRERERDTISLERSREAALALSIDDLLVEIRKTDDIVYRNMYRPLVDGYDERRGRDSERCSCRSVIRQSADLQRSLARSRSSAHAVRALLDVPLVEDRRRRRRSTVQFASEQTM